MRWWWSLAGSGVQGPELVVDADPASGWASLATQLGWGPVTGGAGAALAEAAPGSGAVVIGSGGCTTVRPGSGVLPALVVVGGPLAGRRFALGGQEISLGCGADDVVLPAAGVVEDHLRVIRTPRGEWVVRPTGRAEVLLDGLPCTEETVLRRGSVVQLGACVVAVDEEPATPAQVEPALGGGVALLRPLRSRVHRRHELVTVPPPPPAPSGPAGVGAWVAAVVPIVLALLAALVARRGAALLLGLLAPLVVAVHAHLRERAARPARAAAAQRRGEAVGAALREMADLADAQRRQAWQRLPDPARLAAAVHAWGGQLWERRPEDDDALHLRVGLSVEPVSFSFVDPRQPSRTLGRPGTVAPVPVAVDLRRAGVLHVSGDAEAVAGLGRAVLLHLTTLRSPRDLQVVLLCGAGDEADWRWASWLPHLRGEGNRLLRIATTEAAGQALVRDLRERSGAAGPASGPRVRGPEVVVIVDARGGRLPRGWEQVLGVGGDGDVRAVVLGAVPGELPAGAQLGVAADGSGTLRLASVPVDLPVLVDGVPVEVAAEVAQGLAPLVHLGGDGEQRQPPSFARLVDLLGADRQDPARPAARGRRAGARIVLGAGAGGRVDVDLTGRAGHLLVAGGTEDERRDVLVVAVLGLALDQDRDDLTLALVAADPDQAFGEATRLPHVLPSASGAAGATPDEVVAHVRAEVARRREVLRSWHLPDVCAAWTRDPHAAAQAGLSRLVVAVHEAAAVARTHPDVVPDLAVLAREGRPCGLHLLLADARPDHALPAEIVDDAVLVRPHQADDGDGALVDVHEQGRPTRLVRLADLSLPATPRVVRPRVVRLDWLTLADPQPAAASSGGQRHAERRADPAALVEALRQTGTATRGRGPAAARRSGGLP